MKYKYKQTYAFFTNPCSLEAQMIDTVGPTNYFDIYIGLYNRGLWDGSKVGSADVAVN